MISRFFLNRPVFACVIAILLVLAGIECLLRLPIEQYPNITPPQIQVTTSFPGASAKTLADTVAAPLEDQINGVEDMIYMYSESSSTGDLSLSVYFNIGADADTALNNVQDRVDLALSQLPSEVQKEGVVVKKETPTILMLIALQAEEGRFNEVYTSNYATIHVVDDLLRLPGVSDAKIINARDYAMRIWLKPDRMAQLGIGTSEVSQAILSQNSDYPIGEFGQAPTDKPVMLTLPVTSVGRLETPEQFENIILRANPDGAAVYIKDIGTAELGAQDYSVNGALNGKTTTLIAIYQEYGANALDIASSIRKTMENLSKRFPPGITYAIPYDTTLYIKVSINEVERTLYEAAVLVALVVFVFLQSLRAMIIPVIAMVVSIIGTFIGMQLLGYSLNMLTLFGLVLAIGIVVDDAIVVVENVERNMREKQLGSKEAALQAMQEVSGPVIAIVFVLCSVFLPVAFLGGISGQLYQQFAITLSISVIFSGFVALTLSPVLAAYLFKKEQEPYRWATGFNRGFETCTKGCLWVVKKLMQAKVFATFCYLCVLGTIYVLVTLIPQSFIPDEDQGYLFTFANLPEGSSLDRVEEVTHKIEPIVLSHPGVEAFVSMTGFSLIENINRTCIGTYFLILKDWEERKATSLSAANILRDLYHQFSLLPEGYVIPCNPPAIQGLGTVGGFEFWIVNRGDATDEELEKLTYRFIEKASSYKELARLSTAIQANCIQVYADVDTTKAKAYDVSISDVYETLQCFLGSVYVNNFNKYGRVFQVMLQAKAEYRSTLEDVGNIYVRSTTGNMIPLKSLVTFHYSKGSNLISRFNGFPAAKITGSAAEGFSSQQAMAVMEEIAKELLPLEMDYAWSGEAYQEKTTGGTSTSMLAAALVLVFLILAALYERWALPFAILLVVPFGILGALLAILLRGLENNVYFQIGLITLVALAAKNAILVVEFARERRKEGLSVKDAALEAIRQRLRAIIMTSLTFIIGVLPLVISTGAGAASRHAVGTGVMGGMCVATFVGVFFIPLFYILLDRKKSDKDLSS